MNKKGFTLIEMLVVIAIIAVLVAIIIPTVTSATTKAQAATNAANLRSVKAEITTALLTSKGDFTAAGLTFTAPTGSATAYTTSGTCTAKFQDLTSVTLPSGVTGTFNASSNLSAVVDGTTVTVTYDGLNIDAWAALAK